MMVLYRDMHPQRKLESALATMDVRRFSLGLYGLPKQTKFE